MTEHGAAHSEILDLIGFMRTDLPKVVDGLKWAWSLAWDAPSESQPGRERGASLARPPADPTDECKVNAATFDLGVGNYKAQRAVHAAGPRLAKCDRALAAACVHVHLDSDRQLPVLTVLGEAATLPELLTATRSISWRLDFITDRTIPLDKPTAQIVRRLIVDADKALRAVNGGLGRALNRGKAQADAKQIANDHCAICRIRDRMPDRTRCDTCHTWKQRNKAERPASLDCDYTDAAAAKKRRLARGEGWGAA